MSDYQDESALSSEFKSKEFSNSLFYEDNEVINELSSIIIDDVNPNIKAQNIQELNEKNELKSAYKKQEELSPKLVKESYNLLNIKSTDVQLQSNLTKEDYKKLKSNEIKDEDDIFLKIEDFPENPITEMFLYEEVKDKIRPMIPYFEQDLKSMKLGELKWNNIKQGKRLEVMVENTYGYDIYLKDQMIEELCFLKRVINCWRGVA